MAAFDPQTALTAGGFDPRRASVVELTAQDDYAAALVDAAGDGTDVHLELFRRAPGGEWINAARGDDEAVSDGRAIAAWDAGSHRIVLGFVDREEQAAPAPAPVRAPTRDRGITLIWLTLLTAAIWPAAAGAYVWEGASSVSLFFVVQMLILGLTGFLILRSLLRLWRDSSPATKGFALVLGLLAAFFLLISYSPMTDDRLAAKPVGVVALLVGGNLVALALRELWRVRAGSRTQTRTA